jgi:hypothetical protein
MDAAIYPALLAECDHEILDNLRTTGRADKCGGCGKPFTTARKLKSVARVRHVGVRGVMHDWTCPLCRKCTHENLDASGGVHQRLQRQAFAELLLLVATPGGEA